jgi:diguanylate cyclase (GGDEF)-like protein
VGRWSQAAASRFDPAERFPHALIALNWLLLAGYVIGLIFHGPGFEPLVDGGLAMLTEFIAVIVSWHAVRTAGVRRREVVAVAAAVTAWAGGDLYYRISIGNDVALSFPSAADIGYLLFCPLAVLAIGFAIRRELRNASVTVWLDSGLGALGAASVLAVILDRLFTLASGKQLAGGVALLYPILDLLMIAAIAGIAAREGRHLPRYWLLFLAGLIFFAAADLLTALALFSNTYTAGGTVDALWPIGLALFSLWARAEPSTAARQDRPVPLVLPGIATVAGMVVLIAATRIHESGLAIVLASLTQFASAARTQAAYRQLRRLADLRRQATTDELTGMPNRRAFYADANARLLEDTPQALLLLDLDRFKEVNDSLGHHVGDQLLIEIAVRLREQLRDDDLLARLGGDEFAVLLKAPTRDHADAVAVKLRAAIAMPCTLEGIALRTDVSIGLCFAPEHGNEVSVLLRRADIAMYQAKRARNGHRIYDDLDDAAGAGRLRSLQELHTALAKRQMVLHYQPKLDLASDQVHDVEALVRWNHPVRGLLYPDSFLSLIEDAGLMRRLTQLVLEEALDQAQRWQAQGRTLAIAVNLSASSLVDADLPEQIATMLADRSLPATALHLEITEEFLMADRDRTREILIRIRDLGIEISVDDFGTGYSSLAYLRELPIDELKLDRSFVFPMVEDRRAAALVFSTIGLAHSLGLRMVAEGVETEDALNQLREHGCDQAQGYFISRGLPAYELEHWLEKRNSAPLHQL